MPWPRALRYAAPFAAIALLLALRACVHVDALDRLAPATREANDPGPAYAGSLEIARGGPVVVGFIGTGPARLVVNGQDFTGTGAAPLYTTTRRVILPPGPASIHFSGDARLIWSPVGRRGGGEYIPASSLSPDPPATATFSGGGANVADGLIALAILGVIVATLLVLVRDRLARVSKHMWIALAAIFVGAVAVRWIDLSGFGQAWDEDTNWSAGRNYVTNVLGLDFSTTSWTFNYEHPPVMKYLEGIGAQLSDGFGPARALSSIWTALGCALLVPIGARLYSLRVGVLAGVIAALLPPLIAHGQVVGHESPTVLWWSLGILLSLQAHDDVDKLKARLVGIGVVIGIAIASRFVSGLLGPLCLAILVVRAPVEWRKRTVAWGLAIMPVVALVTLYAVWPRLWLHPIGALQESLAKLSVSHSPEPFLGTITNQPGAYYFLVYLFATLPLGVLLAVVAYGWRGIRERNRSALIVLLWFLIPMGVAVSPVRQDGVRYVMPCLTAFAMMGAAGVDFLAKRVRFEILAGVLVAYLGFVVVRTHPYYLDYFGEQVGGAGTVARHRWFETAWWGEGVDTAVDYVNEHAALNARVYRDCIEPAHLAWFRSDLWTPMAHSPQEATWIVWYEPMDRQCPIPKDAKLVYENIFDGDPMVRVYQR
jgi:hypothetical protein